MKLFAPQKTRTTILRTVFRLILGAFLLFTGLKLNGRPRKTLGWKTPAERLLELV